MKEGEPKRVESITDASIDQIIADTGFVRGDDSARDVGWYDGTRRSYIVRGTFSEQPAVLKITLDPREIDTVAAHQHFAQAETGSLRAPTLLHTAEGANGETVMISEDMGELDSMPPRLSDEQRRRFLSGPFADVVRCAPQLAYREPVEKEQKPASQFMVDRIAAWRELAQQRIAAEGIETDVLERIQQLEEQAAEKIQEAYAEHDQLEWAFGLAKPDKFHPSGDDYVVTDFKSISQRNHGYDFSVAVWADAIVGTLEETQEEGTPTDEAAQMIRKRIEKWQSDWAEVATENQLPDYADAFPAAIMERMLGTLYADTIAQKNNDWSEVERRAEILIAALEQQLAA